MRGTTWTIVLAPLFLVGLGVIVRNACADPPLPSADEAPMEGEPRVGETTITGAGLPVETTTAESPAAEAPPYATSADRGAGPGPAVPPDRRVPLATPATPAPAAAVTVPPEPAPTASPQPVAPVAPIAVAAEAGGAALTANDGAIAPMAGAIAEAGAAPEPAPTSTGWDPRITGGAWVFGASPSADGGAR